MKKKRRTMKPGGGGKKGRAFERKLARKLSEWWYGKDCYLWRRPGNEVRANRPNLHTGDIIPDRDQVLPEPWPFHLEAKRLARSAMKLDMMFWEDRSSITKVWKKAVKMRRKDLIPMLILKANNIPTVCVIRLRQRRMIMHMLGYNQDCIQTYAQVGCGTTTLLVFPWTEICRSRLDKKIKVEI